jgi:anti-sigma B factor antagonist
LDGGFRVVAVRGELDLGTAPELEGPLDQAVDAGEPLLIDLDACDFIDSTGIAMIVRAWQRLAGNGDGNGDRTGRLVISSSNQQVTRVLEITGVEHSIPLYASRDDALAALRG